MDELFYHPIDIFAAKIDNNTKRLLLKANWVVSNKDGTDQKYLKDFKFDEEYDENWYDEAFPGVYWFLKNNPGDEWYTSKNRDAESDKSHLDFPVPKYWVTDSPPDTNAMRPYNDMGGIWDKVNFSRFKGSEVPLLCVDAVMQDENTKKCYPIIYRCDFINHNEWSATAVEIKTHWTNPSNPPNPKKQMMLQGHLIERLLYRKAWPIDSRTLDVSVERNGVNVVIKGLAPNNKGEREFLDGIMDWNANVTYDSKKAVVLEKVINIKNINFDPLLAEALKKRVEEFFNAESTRVEGIVHPLVHLFRRGAIFSGSELSLMEDDLRQKRYNSFLCRYLKFIQRNLPSIESSLHAILLLNHLLEYNINDYVVLPVKDYPFLEGATKNTKVYTKSEKTIKVVDDAYNKAFRSAYKKAREENLIPGINRASGAGKMSDFNSLFWSQLGKMVHADVSFLVNGCRENNEDAGYPLRERAVELGDLETLSKKITLIIIEEIKGMFKYNYKCDSLQPHTCTLQGWCFKDEAKTCQRGESTTCEVERNILGKINPDNNPQILPDDALEWPYDGDDSQSNTFTYNRGATEGSQMPPRDQSANLSPPQSSDDSDSSSDTDTETTKSKVDDNIFLITTPSSQEQTQSDEGSQDQETTPPPQEQIQSGEGPQNQETTPPPQEQTQSGGGPQDQETTPPPQEQIQSGEGPQKQETTPPPQEQTQSGEGSQDQETVKIETDEYSFEYSSPNTWTDTPNEASYEYSSPNTWTDTPNEASYEYSSPNTWTDASSEETEVSSYEYPPQNTWTDASSEETEVSSYEYPPQNTWTDTPNEASYEYSSPNTWTDASSEETEVSSYEYPPQNTWTDTPGSPEQQMDTDEGGGRGEPLLNEVDVTQSATGDDKKSSDNEGYVSIWKRLRRNKSQDKEAPSLSDTVDWTDWSDDDESQDKEAPSLSDTVDWAYWSDDDESRGPEPGPTRLPLFRRPVNPIKDTPLLSQSDDDSVKQDSDKSLLSQPDDDSVKRDSDKPLLSEIDEWDSWDSE